MTMLRVLRQVMVFNVAFMLFKNFWPLSLNLAFASPSLWLIKSLRHHPVHSPLFSPFCPVILASSPVPHLHPPSVTTLLILSIITTFCFIHSHFHLSHFSCVRFLLFYKVLFLSEYKSPFIFLGATADLLPSVETRRLYLIDIIL